MEIMHFNSQIERLKYVRGEFEEIQPKKAKEEPKAEETSEEKPKKAKKSAKKSKKEDE